jgi:hypothetical protein
MAGTINMEEHWICWMSDPPETIATVEEINHFNARGMRRVYRRGDHFDQNHDFQMDIWMGRDGRLLMRCWSACSEIDWRSFEIKGVDISKIPGSYKEKELQCSWVPRAVRNAYGEWIQQEF